MLLDGRIFVVFYVIRRVLQTVPVLIGVTFLVFIMLHLVPGDPVKAMFRQVGDSQSIPEETIEAMRRKLGLDQPLYVQYWRFLTRAVQGDLGESISRQRSVKELIASELPFTVELAVASLIFAVILGVSLGIVSALNQGEWLDAMTMITATFGVSMPSFWFGLIAIYVFAVRLGWLPTSGQGGLPYLVLPAATLGLYSAAVIARLTRSSLLEVLGDDYIRTARAKGLRERTVVLRHGMRNSLIPVVTVVGIRFGALLGGTIVTETVFARRGIGSLMIAALNGRDFPLAQGLVLLVAVTYSMTNLMVDLLYGVLDPRIRYGQT
jgi:ABC-type dipeptide/oligopeptide/nickel transport system permease component